MMLADVLVLLLLTGGGTSNYTEHLDDQQKYNQSSDEVEDAEPADKLCSYQDVLNYLNLTKNNELFFMSRPVKDHRQPTQVSLAVLLYAILDVKEIDQKFVPYVWIIMSWINDYINWNPKDFCGIKAVSLPSEILWKPDITVEEMTEKDKAPPSPYLTVSYDGRVLFQNDQLLVSSCRMHIYKFPFDVQTCNLSFKSVVHSAKEIQLVQPLTSLEATVWSREMIQNQYEWLFISMTVSNKTIDYGIEQDMTIYTIKMKRKSLHYIVNFLLPILFFLCLDLASFLISDSGGEKLSFKITVMLAVTVMQLILNEILPSSSDRVPLIAIYCIGIFGLMMFSLLETILVMYLLEKDSAYQDNDTVRGRRPSKDKRGDVVYEGEKKEWTACICDVSPDEMPAELLKGSSSLLTKESNDFDKLADELREVVKTLAVLGSRKEQTKPGYWTRLTKTINRAFFIFYIITASLFLMCMFFIWNNTQE